MGETTKRRRWPLAGPAIYIWLTVAPSLPVVAAELATQPDAPPAPPLDLADAAGTRHSLSAQRGRVVLVNFWASWCPPCLQEMPSLQRLVDVMADRPLTIYAVNVGEAPGRAKETLRRLGYEGPVLLDVDQKAFETWGVTVLPTSFVVEREGRVRFKAVGALEWDAADVQETIGALIDEAAGARR